MGVTLQQIAEAVGVSRGTVDRALNDRGRIKPEVAEKIKKIAEEMGYQPNRAGRALAMAKQSVRIGVILQSADTPFMKKVLNGIEDAKAEVERMGIEVMVKKLNGIDSVKVMDTMKKMRASGCKGIAMVPVEDEELKKLIHEFVEEGIPVVTFNSDLEDSDRLCFVGQNALQSGKVAAGLMAEILPKGAKVQVISGYPSNQSHRNRSDGFISELNAVRKDVEILDIQYAYDDSKIAGKITEEMLKLHSDLRGVYLAASGTDGVCKVLKNKSLVGKVKVISNDLTTRNEQELKRGLIQFLLGQNAYVQGYSPVMILFDKLFDEKEPEEEHQYTEIMCRVQNQSKAGTALCTFFLFNIYQFVILHKISSFNLAILDIAFTCTQ